MAPAAHEYPMTWEQAVRWLREQPDQQDLVRASYFDDPLAAAALRYYKDPEWQAVRSMLPTARGRALDVGAGRGISSYALARDGWEVTSLEPDPSGLVGAQAIRKLAGETRTRITVVEETGERLPFADESFDLVHARQVLHHAADLAAFCRELARVLKPGGMLIATREHVIDRPGDLPLFLAKHPLHRFYGGENACTVQQYTTALTAAGLSLTRVLSPWETPVNYFPLTMADIKRSVASRLLWPWPACLPAGLIRCISRRLRTPGRLYTFTGVKPI